MSIHLSGNASATKKHVRQGCAAALVAAALLVAGCTSSTKTVTIQENASSDAASIPVDKHRQAESRTALAAGYFSLGRHETALTEAMRAIEADASYAQAHDLVGLIYMRLGDTAKAESSFRQALSLEPANPNLLHNYGWFLCQNNRFSEAESMFDRALADLLYGAKTKTLTAKGICLREAGRLQDAEQTLLRSYELDAANPITGFYLSQTVYDLGDYTRAQFYIRRVNNGNSSNAMTLWHGIKVEYRMGDTTAMEQLALQLRKRYPDSSEMEKYLRSAFNE